MAAFIVPDDDSGRIITFDVIEQELHENVAETAEHPVESGFNPTDHVRPQPDALSLIAYTTNQPITSNPFTKRGELRTFEMDPPVYTIPVEPTPGSLYRKGLNALGALFGDSRSVTILAFPDVFDAIRETHEVLVELLGNGVLVSIVTPLKVYEDMIITRVSAPRNAGDSGVSFGIDVKHIRIVESGSVTAAPVPADDVPGGKPLQDKGGQGAKPPGAGEDAEKPGSIAYQILSGQGLI